jgi:CHAT domain-containing protein
MFTDFKNIIFIFLLLSGGLVYSQSNTAFEQYLKGNYHALTTSDFAVNKVYLASAYTHLDDYQKAEKLFLSVGTEEQQSALYLNEKGFLLLKMYQLDQAKTHFEHALTISETAQDKEGVRLSSTNLALYHFAVGNYELQYDFAQKALEQSVATYGLNTVITARMYNNLALALSGLEDNEESLKNYELALAIYKQNKGPYINPYICRVKINIALLKLAEEDFYSAEQFALEALNYTNEESSNIIFVNITIGSIYTQQKELVYAENYLFEALKLNPSDHVKERVDIYNRIADVARLQGNYERALLYLDSALVLNVLDIHQDESLENILSMDASLSSYYIRGETYFDRYYKQSLKVRDLKLAVTSFESCLLTLDEERKLRVTQKDKIRLGLVSRGVYDKLIKSCYDLSVNTFNKEYYNAQVFLHIQHSKATVLNASLNENEALHFSGVPDGIIEKERLVKSKLMYFEQLVAIDNSNKHYTDSLAFLRVSYRAFILGLEKDHPRYFNLKYQKKEKTQAALQKELVADKVLCSYYLTSNAKMIYIACLDKKQMRINEVYAGDDLLSEITKMRNFIYYSVFDGYNKISHKLYNLLIPDRNFVRGKSIVFFPDSQLNTIPFEALSTQRKRKGTSWGEEPFLLREHVISYGISTALYQPYQLGKLDEYALFAPVTFDYSDEESYISLPYTKKEVLAIDSVTKKETTKVSLFIEGEVSKQSITTCNADVIHLATHGLIDQKNPELSKLCLSPNPEGGFLYNNEIYDLKISAELVTMSACETGLGKLSKGEGVIGLTRAWVYAGTKNLIVSYWAVNDAASSTLMTNFYSNVSNKKTFSLSLQEAKLAILKGEGTQAPYFWVGFVLVGE